MKDLDNVMEVNDEHNVDDVVASRWLMIIHDYFSCRDVSLECFPMRMEKLVPGRAYMVFVC